MKSRILQSSLTLVITFCMMFYSLQSVVIFSDFYLNQEEIARTLCVQRDNQQGCNGKCHLMKKINQINKDIQATSPTQNTEKEQVSSLLMQLNLPENLFELTLYKFSLYKKSIQLEKNLYTSIVLNLHLPPPKGIV